MRPAEIERTTADIAVNAPGRDIALRAVGSVVTFPGFLAVYGVEAKSDKRRRARTTRTAASCRRSPSATSPKLDEALIEQHFTQPPPRYTEASLIKKMEELGIGRPSTYAATISVLQDRNYVRLEKRALIPEDRGRIVTAFLENFFAKLVEYGFTAGLEEKLDDISAGKLAWKDVLRDFWTDFTKQTDEIKDLRVSEVLDALNDIARRPHLPGQGRRLRSAPLPHLRHRPAVAEAGQVRRLHRLLELPRVQAHHAALGRRHRWRRRPPPATASSAPIPRVGRQRALEVRPFRPICAARRRRRAQALLPPQGLDSRTA